MRKAKILIPTVLFPLILLSLIIAAVFTSPEPPEPVSVGPIIMSQIACLADSSDQITVVLEPTYEAIADKVYNIEVKKGDVLRAITSVSWAQQELQAKQAKGFQFPTTADEFQFYAMDRNQLGYAWKNLSEEFTVIEYAEGTSTKYKVPFSAVAPSPPSTPFNWWFVWIPLVGLVLLVVYIRILTSYIQEKRDYEIAEEQKRREQEEIEKQKRVEFAREGKATQCPKCHKWHAQVDDGSKVIKKEPGYKTVDVVETFTHYDKDGLITSSGEKVRNVQRHVINYTRKHFYHCKFCGHKWTHISHDSEEG